MRKLQEIENFYNAGFGWICQQCERELHPNAKDAPPHSRLFREGESESKNPELANPALARWEDKARQILTCPRCGISEAIYEN